MQQQQQQRNVSVTTATISPSMFNSPDRQLQYHPDDPNFLNPYSMFSPNSTPLQPFPYPMSHSPTPRSSHSEDDMTISSTQHRICIARYTLEFREMEDRYEVCLSHLRETVEEVNALRQEIFRLRKANTDLAKQLNPTGRKQRQSANVLTLPTPLSLINDIRRLNFEDSGSIVSSPTSVLRQEQAPQNQRVTFPKSISIRSNGFVKGNPGSSGRRVSTPVLLESQRVYVPRKGMAGEQELREEPVFQVYGQGMFKTELCNKWEETGSCPYGNHCQFAHGIAELRPVIRHPRYKTEVCRMVLAGEACPYGHRCHFRHALGPDDRGLLGSVQPLP